MKRPCVTTLSRCYDLTNLLVLIILSLILFVLTNYYENNNVRGPCCSSRARSRTASCRIYTYVYIYIYNTCIHLSLSIYIYIYIYTIMYLYDLTNRYYQDWDDMEAVWDYTFRRLGVDPSEHKVVQTEAALNPRYIYIYI